jgi:hypothetical protein
MAIKFGTWLIQSMVRDLSVVNGVLRKNTDKDGNVHIYKTQLMTKGFKQIHGVDYDETF